MVWDELKYWDSGEYQVVQERLADLKVANLLYNPIKANLFRALKLTPFEEVKVVLLGQDPYPDPRMATGLAFSIPEDQEIPPTLANIFKEYCNDLKYEYPPNGDLTKWAKQGVLLWNVIPSCQAYKSMSHYGIVEWKLLTQEILEKLSEKGIVFVAIGAVAREFVKYIDPEKNEIIELAHPSPRNLIHKYLKNPFNGSRMFTTVNDKLRKLGEEVIDWRL